MPEEAEAALRREAKAAAMSMVERIAIGEARLRIWGSAEADTFGDGGRAIFASVALSDLGSAGMSMEDRALLESGRALVRLVRTESDIHVRLLVSRSTELVGGRPTT